MNPADLTKQLFVFLQSVDLPFTTGNWTCKNRGVVTKRDLNGNIIDYRVDFENSNTLDIFRIKIWFNSGRFDNGVPAHNPPHWFIRVTNLTSGIQIHNIDLEIKDNYNVVNANVSEIKETYNRLGGVYMAQFPCLKPDITTIDNRVRNWQILAIKELLDHEVCREMVINSLNNRPLNNIKKPQAVPLVIKQATIKSPIIYTKKTEFQKNVIRSIFSILKYRPTITNKNHVQRFKDYMLKPMVRHYPEITRQGETTNGNIKRYELYFKWSERAFHIYNQFPKGTKDDIICKKIKMEHIYPVRSIVNELYNLPVYYSIEDIIRIFDYSEKISCNGGAVNLGYEILIVSDQEARVLNSKENNDCQLLDCATGSQVTHKGAGLGSKGTIAQRLAAANIVLEKKFINNRL